MKTVSIVMRSRNDIAFVRRTIDAILAQTRQPFEILSFDNASTDGTAEVIAEYPQIKKFNIPEGEYVPGKVLNMAVANCLGDVVVFNNADAVPMHAMWLENLVKPFDAGAYGAAYARQVCRNDADAWVASDYSRAFGDKAISPEFFSMASSAANTDVLRENPFDPDIKYSEDVLWAKGLRDKGIKVCYVPDSWAEHSHNYTLPQIKKRFAGEGVADAEIYRSAQSPFTLIKGIVGGLIKDFSFLLKHGRIAEIFECWHARITQKYSYYSARRKRAKELA